MELSQDRSWLFNGSVENETRLKPLCQQVEAHFTLPARRLCRYFAVGEDVELLDVGKYYRGFQAHYPTDEDRKTQNATPNASSPLLLSSTRRDSRPSGTSLRQSHLHPTQHLLGPQHRFRDDLCP